MIQNTTVVAICGTLAEDSVTRVALREMLTAAADEGTERTLVDESIEDRVRRLGTELVQYADVEQYPEIVNTTAPHPHAD